MKKRNGQEFSGRYPGKRCAQRRDDDGGVRIRKEMIPYLPPLPHDFGGGRDFFEKFQVPAGVEMDRIILAEEERNFLQERSALSSFTLKTRIEHRDRRAPGI